MKTISIPIDLLGREAFLGSTPEERGTWIGLLRYCAIYSESDWITGAGTWEERKLNSLLLCGEEEIRRESALWKWVGNSILVWGCDHLDRQQVGPYHWNWKGGITPEVRRIRSSAEYKDWRNSVFTRDDYTCQYCGVKGGALVAHHIKPFADYPELRLDISNGITLCRDCHIEEHTGRGEEVIDE